ncbi:MAG TPA: M81 family metallopeptidase, partial [Planctomycetaceae bacterium]|nr:M81 family metallopeptidase [Planctomycetaceae bacterium]
GNPMRVGIIGLLHESNTFLSRTTKFADFENVTLLTGSAICEQFAGGLHELGGFVDGLAGYSETIETVPLFVARALPSGTVETACWNRLLEMILDQLEAAGPLDGILVAPHGATVSEEFPDADGHWLSVVRRRVGPDVPLIGTIDPHANLSPQMVSACDALLAYRTNPHLDQRERGLEAAELMVRTLRKEIRPTMSAAFPPLAINIERQMTQEAPLSELCKFADAQKVRPGMLSNSIVLGFPYADVPEMGSATIAVTDNDPELARKMADELAAQIWDRREELKGRMIDIETALDRCRELPGPVCLLDMGDNVGGGSAADGTFLAHALHRRQDLTGFVCLFDPDAVQKASNAGVGSTIKMSVGGKSDDLHGEPLTAEFRVRSLHAGKFRETQVRHGGFSEFDQGSTAIVETESGLTIMLTSRRMVPFSLQQLLSCDVDPKRFQVIVAKGVNAPLAAYQEVCPNFLRVNTPGSTCADMHALEYRFRRWPLYPLEESAA